MTLENIKDITLHEKDNMHTKIHKSYKIIYMYVK